MAERNDPPAGGKARPNRSEQGERQAQARQARLAAQLRANLQKRKQQQRSRAAGDDGGEGDS